nr:FUSC family protein [Micromonospora sp. HNM0581]
MYAILAVQAGVAAAVAWTLAHELLGHPSPVFAPSAAVGTIAAAIGRRARRTLELLVGVLAGLLVGDALIMVIGTGPWQIGTVVTLAILFALTMSRGGSVVTQAGGTAVLIATLSPIQGGLEVPRVIDAVIGAISAVLVVAVLPVNPVRIIQRAARPLFAALIEHLHDAADGMSRGDAAKVARARDGLFGLSSQLALLNDAVTGAQEAVAVSPARWHRRREFEHYQRGIRYLDLAVGGGQEMLRRAATAVHDDEPIPTGLAAAVDYFGDALALLQVEAESQQHSKRSEQLVLKAVDYAAEAYDEGVGFSGSVVVAQIRTVATDLLRSIGRDEEEAVAVVRRRFEDRRHELQR